MLGHTRSTIASNGLAEGSVHFVRPRYDRMNIRSAICWRNGLTLLLTLRCAVMRQHDRDEGLQIA